MVIVCKINNPLIVKIFESIATKKENSTWNSIHNDVKFVYDSDPRGKDYFDPSSINMRILEVTSKNKK